jgi:hypothetical protein
MLKSVMPKVQKALTDWPTERSQGSEQPTKVSAQPSKPDPTCVPDSTHLTTIKEAQERPLERPYEYDYSEDGINPVKS